MRCALLLILGISAPAMAQDEAWPMDVNLSGMSVHDEARMPTEITSEAYQTVVKELGTAISNQPVLPADTLGQNGFEVGFHNTFAFISARSDGTDPAPWELAHENETPGQFLFVPTISARKGLPMSTELGVTMSWVGLSRTGVFSGYGRIALLEGFKPLPDVTIQVGYAGYVGNDELELGVLDVGITIGSQFPFGSFPGIRQARFTPFLTYNTLRISARPVVDVDTANELGVLSYGGADGDPAPVLPQLGGGFQLTNGSVYFRVTGAWAFQTIPTAHLGMGFTY